MRLALVLLVGCSSGSDDDGSFVIPGNRTADTGADTDIVTPEPCPFEGSWTIGASTCDALPLNVSGTATFSGTADRCLVRFEGTAPSSCSVVEQVELLPAPFGLWEAYTDGAPGSQSCLAFPGPARAIGDVGILTEGGGLVLSHYGQAAGVALKIVDPCDSVLELVLQR